MSQIDEVGQTAFFISSIRAVEARRPRPIFHDPLATVFAHERVDAEIAAFETRMPGFVASIRVRTRWLDDTVAAALDDGARQVVVLGAGFDVRALRLARPGVTSFEVDRAGTLAYKAERLAAAGHQTGAVYVAADYTAPGFVDALVARGFDRAVRTLVIWEGDTFSLPPGGVPAVLAELRRGVPDLLVAFDYVEPALVEGRSVAPSHVGGWRYTRSMGAPWQSAVADLDALAAEVGLRVQDKRWVGDLLPRWLPELDLGPDGKGEYWLGLLTSRSA